MSEGETPREMTAIEIADRQWRLEHSKIAYQATFEFAKIALNAMVIANGGAVLALLTFLGAMWKEGAGIARSMAAGMVLPIGMYAAGLFFGIVAAMLTYASQSKYASKSVETGDASRNAAILAGLLSVGLFGLGSLVAVLSFTGD